MRSTRCGPCACRKASARAMAFAVPDGLKGLRDRALLPLGFAGAFRRSELVALDVADLEETEDGFKVVLRRRRPISHGETIAIARGVTTCPTVRVALCGRPAASFAVGIVGRRMYYCYGSEVG